MSTSLGINDPSPRLRRSHPVPTPARLKSRFPLGASAARNIDAFRAQAIALVQGDDDRLLCVVGPCSIHDPEAATEYAARLAPLAGRHRAELLVVMRVYLEKPRSSVGWKGLISDPDLDDSCDVPRGLAVARELMVGIAESAVPIATELLDGNLSTYFTDLITWAAIGARTTESQPHRELASSLAFPVGFKNGTDGRVDGAIGGMSSARERHRRLAPSDHGRLALCQSAGNPHCHLTLRGGALGPNYDAESVARASQLAERAGLPARVLIDCSHGNSGKNHENQPIVLGSVAAQVAAGATNVLGVMIESHLVAGRQALVCGRAGLRYGQSITDACVDFETSETMLEVLAASVRQRRAGTAQRGKVTSSPR
jgi:3-deoxy-7-phosphoheptulonate synthase